METIAILWLMFKEWLKTVFGGGIHFSTNEVFGEHPTEDE